MTRFFYWLVLLVAVLPLLVILLSFTRIEVAVWQHLVSTVLPHYIVNSIVLAVGVGVFSAIIGTSLAWCLTRYRFPASRTLAVMSILPLAMPAYIIAYTYTGLLDFTGPLQTLLRDTFNWQYGEYWFPQIRSLGGAVLMLSFVLFPYVYLLARNAFTSIPTNLKDASLGLGRSERVYFWRVALPLVRPAIIAGVVLTMMEALADYGTVAFFGVNTFTTGIFRTWFGMGSRDTALQLSGILTLFVFICVAWEHSSRRKIEKDKQVVTFQPQKIGGFKGGILTLICSIPLLLGFVIPLVQLVFWAFSRHAEWQLHEYWPLIYQTLYLAVAGAILTAFIALFVSYARRLQARKLPYWTLHVIKLGYALPGVIVAVGLLVPLGFLDRQVNYASKAWFDVQPGLLLSGTLFVVLVAYVIRFIAIAMQHTQNGLNDITPNMDNAALILGAKPRRMLFKVHLPLMKNSVIAACLLVFVDIMKELPATLVLRPFNFNTLAVKAYEYAMDERLQQAALPALTIVACGIIPVFVVVKQMRKNEAEHASG